MLCERRETEKGKREVGRALCSRVRFASGLSTETRPFPYRTRPTTSTGPANQRTKRKRKSWGGGADSGPGQVQMGWEVWAQWAHAMMAAGIDFIVNCHTYSSEGGCWAQ